MIEQLSGAAAFQACPRMGPRGRPGDLDPRRLRNERSKILGGTHIGRSIRAHGLDAEDSNPGVKESTFAIVDTYLALKSTRVRLAQARASLMGFRE